MTNLDPTPDLTTHLAEVLAEAAADHGTHDHHGQAAAILTWLGAQDRLASPGYVLQLAERGTQIDILDSEIADLRDELAVLREQLHFAAGHADLQDGALASANGQRDEARAIVSVLTSLGEHGRAEARQTAQYRDLAACDTTSRLVDMASHLMTGVVLDVSDILRTRGVTVDARRLHHAAGAPTADQAP